MNALLQELSSAPEDAVIDASMNVSFKVLDLLTSETREDVETIIGDRILTLPNSERQDGWFQNHPWMAGAKSAFDLFDGDTSKIQAKFYWLRKRSSSNLVGAVHFTPNWEDHDYTRNENFKIGLDFFLTSDADGVIVALSNRGKVRVMELSSKLSNTQVEVMQNWWGLESSPLEQIHAQIWESFRLQEVNSKFYRGVSDAFVQLHDSLVKQGRPEEDAKMFASRLLGRLIFVWFLRKMNLIDSSIGYFDASQDSGGYYRQALERLFFRTLNSRIDDRLSELNQIDLTTPYLNGGLFSPREDDWYGDETLVFPQDFFVDLYAHFDDFNFTTDESTPEYEQVAIDPEMLGRVFESLLASQVEETGDQARKAKGAFYTPREIVSYMCRESVREYLLSALDDDARAQGAVSKLIDTADHEWAINGSNSKRDIPKELQVRISSALREVKTVDPACGSGAFPLGLLQLLSKLQLRLDSRLDIYKLKLSILQDNIFGSDIEPMAVEISRLRSWLSLIVEEKGRPEIQPLPNLEFNFVCANSLLKLKEASLDDDPDLQQKLAVLREKFFSTSEPSEKLRVQRKFIDAINPDLLDENLNVRGKQIKSYNPFDSEAVAQFFDAEYMFGISSGFDIVIGNPPYIDYRKIPKQLRSELKTYSVGRFSSMISLYLYFFELGFEILAKRGVLAYITPQQYLVYENTRGLRDLIRDKCTLVSLSDFARVKVFDASTYTFVSIYRNQPAPNIVGKYLEFAELVDFDTIREKDVPNPIPEPLDISEYSEAIDAIERASAARLGEVASIFCASSDSGVKVSPDTVGPKFIAASNIFEWRVESSGKNVDVGTYSKNSIEKQHQGPAIYTSRMTTRIRAVTLEPLVYLGGKVNVIIPSDSELCLTFTAFLNSDLLNFWYRQKFSMQHLQGGALPINTTELKALPLPAKSPIWLEIAELSAKAQTVTGSEFEMLWSEINDLILEAFNFSESEKMIVTRALESSAVKYSG